MKIMNKTTAVLTLALIFFATAPLPAQSKTDQNPNSGSSVESLKEDLLKLGQDLKITASEAGDLISQWLGDQSSALGEKAAAATSQTKLGVVLGTNRDNLTVTIVDEEGKTHTFATTEDTPVTIQDAVTGLQTPFSGGKNAKFKNIKKGDWLHYTYNLKDFVQTRLPDSDGTPVTAQAVEILR